MDNDKVNEVFRSIADRLQREGCPPCRWEGVALSDRSAFGFITPRLSHCHALALAGLDLPAEKLEKKFRWLGWIQGVLWSFGLQSIEDQKRANMPDAEK